MAHQQLLMADWSHIAAAYVRADHTDEEAAEATVRELEQEHNLRVAQMTVCACAHTRA
jgi:hypothetical protein